MSMKHALNKTPEQQREFLDSLYDDILAYKRNGFNKVSIALSAVLDIVVADDDGTRHDEEKIFIEIRITNIDELGENMALTLGSMVGTLLDNNNIGEFDYELSELGDEDENPS